MRLPYDLLIAFLSLASLLGLAVGAYVYGYRHGVDAGKTSIRIEAIRHNVGHWEAHPDGRTEFVWGAR